MASQAHAQTSGSSSSSANTSSQTSFIFDDSLSPWDHPMRSWLSSNSKPWDGVATSALVFDAQNRILLVQRTATDSMPNLWETPGGAVDDEDVSILHGCARELFEETGLVARRIRHLVTEGPGAEQFQTFRNSTRSKLIGKFVFEVEIAPGDEAKVKLDPKEHQAFVWATEEEVQAEKVGDLAVPFTRKPAKDTIVEGFRLRREELLS